LIKISLLVIFTLTFVMIGTVHASLIFSDDFSEFTTNTQGASSYTSGIPSYTSSLNTIYWQPVNPYVSGSYTCGVDLSTKNGYASNPSDTSSTISAYATGSGGAQGLETPILAGSGSTSPAGQIAFDTTASYTISLDLGNRPGFAPGNGKVVVNLLAGNTVVGGATFSPQSAPSAGWTNVSFTISAASLAANYSALNGEPLTIQLLNNDASGTHLDFTNLQVNSTQPPQIVNSTGNAGETTNVIFADNFSEFTSNVQNSPYYISGIPSYTNSLNTISWQSVTPYYAYNVGAFGVDVSTECGYSGNPSDTSSRVSAYATGYDDSNGLQTQILTGSGSSSPGAPLALDTCATYTITLDLGNRPGFAPANGSVVVNLLAGDVVVGTSTFSPQSAAPGGWSNVSFTIPAATLAANYGPLKGLPLSLQILNNGAASSHVDFTNVLVTESHPKVIFSDDFSEFTANFQGALTYTSGIPTYTSTLNSIDWQPVNSYDTAPTSYGVDISTACGYSGNPSDTSSTISAYATGSGYAGGLETPILTGSGSTSPGSPQILDTTSNYTISMDLGNRPGFAPGNGSIVANLLAGGTIVGSGTFSPQSIAPLSGWSNVSFTISAASLAANASALNGQPLSVQLLNNGSSGSHLDFTNLQVVQAHAPKVANTTLNPGEFKIIADAAATADNDNPTTPEGSNVLRADYNAYAGNKAYIRFYIGWAKGHHITSATLHLSASSSWASVAGESPKVFGVYALKSGTPGNQTGGWNENTITAQNAPGNITTSNGFDPSLTDTIDNWTITSNPPVQAGWPLVFSSPNLTTEIANDADGYITLCIVQESGPANNSVFDPRVSLGSFAPWLDVQTDATNNLDETQPTFIVTNGARQTMTGWGAELAGDNNPMNSPQSQNGQNYGALTPQELQQIFQTEYTATGMNTSRLFVIDSNAPSNTGIDLDTADYNSFVNSYFTVPVVAAAQAAGVTRFILCSNPPTRFLATQPSADADGYTPLSSSGLQDYPLFLADFVAKVKANLGLNFYMITIANEEIHIGVSQWPIVVKNLRQDLDAQGLNNVKIGAVDWPNNDEYAWSRLSSIQNDPTAWSDLDVCTTHNYSSSIYEAFYEQFSQGQGKEFWTTESACSGLTETSTAKDLGGHIMNDLNHGISCWLYFIDALNVPGYSPEGDYPSSLVGFDPTQPANSIISLVPKYYYYKQIATSFPVGCSMRRIWGSTVGDAWYPGFSTPVALTTGGKNADGSWSIAVLNTAEDSTPYAQTTYTIAVEELAGVASLPVTVTQLTEGTSTSNCLNPPTSVNNTGVTYVPLNSTTTNATINNGKITLTLGPNELVTLHSAPVTNQ